MVVGDESFADVSEGVFPLATAVEVLGKDVVGGEQAKDALEVLRVAAAVWTNGGEDLGGGERSVATASPDGVGDLHAEDGNEGHRDTHHVCKFQNGKSRFVLRPYSAATVNHLPVLHCLLFAAPLC